MIKNTIIKHKSLIMYCVTGVLTTVVNWGTYSLCFYSLHLSNIVSNIIAWVLAVATAFITNKMWVFDSTSWSMRVWIPEAWKFTLGRLLTGAVELLLMWILVDLIPPPDAVYYPMLMKILTSVFVVVCNYFFSKLLVFRKKENDTESESR